MTERTSVRISIIALACSAALAALALTAAAWTGAAVMMALAVQALVGASHQALLLKTLSDAGRTGASEQSPDMRFLSFAVAILLYALGAGVALAKGTETLTAARAVFSPLLDVLALALALGIQGAGLTITLALVHGGEGSAHETQRAQKTPPVTALLIEHAGAIASLLIAALGVAFLALLKVPAADGAAATSVALVMALMATVMSLEVRKQLRDKREAAVEAPQDERPSTDLEPQAASEILPAAAPAPRVGVEAAGQRLSRKEKRRLKRQGGGT